MTFGTVNRRIFRWLGFLIGIGIFALTIFYSNKIVTDLKEQEENKVQNFAKALEINATQVNLTDASQEFILKILESNTSIPALIVDENLNYLSGKNIPLKILNDSLELRAFTEQMALARSPIEIQGAFGTQYVIYENSTLLDQLRYYPLVLIAIIIIFVAFCFWYFRMLKESEQSFLWAGMAKETAHQIGTPLSSLMGWVELLKLEENLDLPLEELDKDLDRLKTIAERFSKIGSKPEIKNENLVDIVSDSYAYLKPRISKNIAFNFDHKDQTISCKVNKALISWVLENLVKNAIDAMQNKGEVTISLTQDKKHALLQIRDNGPGIPNALQKRIFEPGYTTKKRGWGLGLSLAKRIIEKYHKGKIHVSESNKNGTCFDIQIPL